MPSKNKRAASRQAQLSQRRRRRGGRGRGAVHESRPTSEVAQASEEQSGSTTGTSVATRTVSAVPRPPVGVSTPVRESTGARSRSARARAQAEPLQIYPYLGPELRRIGALTGVIVIALAILTVILR